MIYNYRNKIFEFLEPNKIKFGSIYDVSEVGDDVYLLNDGQIIKIFPNCSFSSKYILSLQKIDRIDDCEEFLILNYLIEHGRI